jgi:hypothetical protein
MITGVPARVFKEKILIKTCNSYRKWNNLPHTMAALPRSSRSPGCWAQDPHIIPIPGTKRRSYLEQNWEALNVSLSAADVQALNQIFPEAVAGERYPAATMKMLNG